MTTAPIEVGLLPEPPMPFLRLVPSVDPPFDDERPPWERTWPPQPPADWIQLPLLDRMDLQLPCLLPPVFEQFSTDSVTPPAGDPDDDDSDFGRQPTSRESLPDPRPVAKRYVRAILEVLSGQRQSRQLTKVTTPEVLDQLERLGVANGPVVWATTLRSLHLSEPVPGVAEVCAVLERDSRSTALAMRMAGLDGRWVITSSTLL